MSETEPSLPPTEPFDAATLDAIVDLHFANEPGAAWAAMRAEAFDVFRPSKREEERALLAALSEAVGRHVEPERRAVLARLVVIHLASAAPRPVEALLHAAADACHLDPADAHDSPHLREDLYALLLPQPNPRALATAVEVEEWFARRSGADPAAGTRALKRLYLEQHRHRFAALHDEPALLRALGFDPDRFYTDAEQRLIDGGVEERDRPGVT